MTTILYGLPSHSRVTLSIFNTLGQQVAALVEGEQEAGFHEVRLRRIRLGEWSVPVSSDCRQLCGNTQARSRPVNPPSQGKQRAWHSSPGSCISSRLGSNELA